VGSDRPIMPRPKPVAAAVITLQGMPAGPARGDRRRALALGRPAPRPRPGLPADRGAHSCRGCRTQPAAVSAPRSLDRGVRRARPMDRMRRGGEDAAPAEAKASDRAGRTPARRDRDLPPRSDGDPEGSQAESRFMRHSRPDIRRLRAVSPGGRMQRAPPAPNPSRPSPACAARPGIDPTAECSALAHVEQAKPWNPAIPPVNARSRTVSRRSHPLRDQGARFELAPCLSGHSPEYPAAVLSITRQADRPHLGSFPCSETSGRKGGAGGGTEHTRTDCTDAAYRRQ